MHFFITSIWLALFTMASQNTFANRDQEQGPQLTSAPPPEITKLASRYGLTVDSLSVCIAAIDSADKTLPTPDCYNQHTIFPLASVSKILTAYYALSILGFEYRFSTKIVSVGEVKDGVLLGDIYLQGGGDPLLGNDGLFELALRLKQLGISKVKGHFYYDDTLFSSKSEISNIGPGDQTYNPGISALSSVFNRFTLGKEGGRATHNATFTALPPLPSLQVVVSDKKFTLGKRFEYDWTAFPQEKWLLSTKEKYKHGEEIPVRNPSQYTAEIFALFCSQVGLALTPPTRKKIPAISKTLFVVKSIPLQEIMRLTLEYSNNLLAEIILLMSSKTATGKDLSLNEAAREMINWYKKQFPKIPWDEVQMVNGSGLTVENQASSQLLTLLLKSLALPKNNNGPLLWPLLSLSGQNGWLKERFNSPSLFYKIWAKTGSLDYVSNIAGYLTTKSNKVFAFSILSTDWKARDIIDKVGGEKGYKLTLKSGRFRDRTQIFAKELLAHWYETL